MTAGAPLNIVQIGTPWFSVPPTGYGGIEAVMAGLVDGLVDLGHHVHLIGVGENGTTASFTPTTPLVEGLRVGSTNPEVLHAARVGRLLRTMTVDVVHDHSTAGPLQAAQRAVPTIVTAHGPVTGEIGDYYTELAPSVSLVAISDAQRRQAPHLPFEGLVHNAVRTADYPWRRRREDYVLFLGRFSPEKGVHLAIDAAQAAGVRIVLAGTAHAADDRAYVAREITPRLGPDVILVGEVGGSQKTDLLSRARCLLFPVQWEEPFGMVLVEAMACGTPVVALDRGSVAEIVTDGVTGFVRQDLAGLVEGIRSLAAIDTRDVRRRAVEFFDVAAMAAGYEAVYRRVIAASPRPRNLVAIESILPLSA